MTTYSIIDIQTKYIIGKVYNDQLRARRQAEKLDMKYGTARYIVKTNFNEEK